VAATVPPALAGQRMASGRKVMLLAPAAVTIWRGTRASGVEAVRGPGRHAEQAAHHGLPLVTMWPCPMAVLQMVHQPVGHLVRHHLDQEGEAILLQQQRIEAQPAATEVRLSGALSSKIQPDQRARQCRMDLVTTLIGRLDLLDEGAVQGGPVESVETDGVGSGKRGDGHGMLEWRLHGKT